jgi:exonuclease III
MAAKCPDKSPILCEKETISRGLCVSRVEDCNTRSNSLRNIPILEVNPLSARYGYKNSPDLGKHCYYTNVSITLNYVQKYEDPDTIPGDFSCLTYNIWGLAKNDDIKKLFDLRKPILEQTIRGSGADMLCLQEISSFAYSRLKGLFSEYKFASETPYPDNSVKRRNRGVDVYFVSKFRPASVYIYGLEGVLGYANALMAIEYPNLVVFNLYSQAGSKSSPGQAEKWLHYSRCRYDILQSIRDLMASTFSDIQQFIICGDFNFHLDGTLDDWPEMEMINKLKSDGFVDSYRKVNRDPGYTEDTDLNKMRWNQKLIEKFYRFDAILYKGPLTVKKSVVIGQEEVCLSKADSDWFIDKLSDAKGGRESQLKTCAGGLPINPSDHFGVLTWFTSRKGGKRRKTRRLKNTIA